MILNSSPISPLRQYFPWLGPLVHSEVKPFTMPIELIVQYYDRTNFYKGICCADTNNFPSSYFLTYIANFSQDIGTILLLFQHPFIMTNNLSCLVGPWFIFFQAFLLKFFKLPSLTPIDSVGGGKFSLADTASVGKFHFSSLIHNLGSTLRNFFEKSLCIGALSIF